MSEVIERQLQEVVAAINVVEAELILHAERLADKVVEVESEGSHLRSLSKSYAEAARTLAILRRYQEGRLRSLRARKDESATVPATIDEEAAT